MLDTHQRAQCNFSVKVAIFCQYIATKHLKLRKKVPENDKEQNENHLFNSSFAIDKIEFMSQKTA